MLFRSDTNDYLLGLENKKNLSEALAEKEYCLASHNIYDPIICKFAIQILFNTQIDIDVYQKELTEMLYDEFGKFLYDNHHIINLELLFNEYMKEKKIKFEYTLFNQINEQIKLTEKKNIKTDSIINSNKYLPILKGDFNICDNNFEPIKLFFDLNILNADESD